MNLIETIRDRCHECYACVRNCPARAVRVRDGQAEVISERCLNCANCFKICSQGAKEIKDYLPEVRDLLEHKDNDVKVVAGIAPSFPAFNPDLSITDWNLYLKNLGFDSVYEVAWGAQLMIAEYREYLRQNDDLVISTACPVIVNYIEKYYPRLVSNLAPLVSPMGALVRYLKEIEEDEVRVVLIGPCHAKKGEFEDVSSVGGVLTYSELQELGQEMGYKSLNEFAQMTVGEHDSHERNNNDRTGNNKMAVNTENNNIENNDTGDDKGNLKDRTPFYEDYREHVAYKASSLEQNGDENYGKVNYSNPVLETKTAAAAEAVTGVIDINKFNLESWQQLTNTARKIPLAGGLKEAVADVCDEGDFIKVEGRQKLTELFDSITAGEIKPRFIDALFCEGCINGVDLSESSHFKKENAVNKFIEQPHLTTDTDVTYDESVLSQLHLEKVFTEDYQNLPQPDEEKIWNILNKTKKYSEDDLLNCGACGYDSCRKKAVAVLQGLAEVEMCLPYLISEKRSEIQQTQQLNRELDSVINASYDGMVVVTKKGKVLRVNESYLNMVGVSREEIEGKDVTELEKERVIYPSVSRLSLREKRNITLVQNTSNGKRILVTATPVVNNQEEIDRVIVNARDLKELDLSVDDPEEKANFSEYLTEEDEVAVTGNPGHIISYSAPMKKIIKLAGKIGNTDSTVLITGESGVGKEVIARYIHEESEERDNFVKINCAAIPERLLESELFGYETGAFSGARREGKQGLIEKADNGTLFLDEIGEMPINMQAKLLQVIQEHRVTRIGGVDSIEVNFRLITATNRKLKDMIANKEFREDLYYRLNVVPIHIPPLRERRSDIIPLVKYFSSQLSQKYEKNIEFSQEARKLLLEYDWPGNVREITNLLERVIVTSEEEVIEKKFLQQFMENEENNGEDIVVNNVVPLKEAVARVEKEILLRLKEQGKTTYEMADILDVNQSTIVRKLKKYGS